MPRVLSHLQTTWADSAGEFYSPALHVRNGGDEADLKTFAKILVGLVLSALTLYLFVRNLDLVKVRDGLAAANVPLLVTSILVGYFGHLSLRARRWATMLHPIKSHISFYNLFSTTAIGYALSGLTPGRLGEVARPVLLARREGMSVAGVLGTTAIERVLDAATIAVLAAGAAVSAPLWWRGEGAPMTVVVPFLGEAGMVRVLAWLGVLGLAGSIAGLLVLRSLVLEDSSFLRLVDRRRAVPGRMGRVWAAVRHLAEGAAFLRDGRRTLRVGVESVAIWLTISVSSWIGLLAAGVRIPIPGTALLVALSALGIAVPTPGGAGTVHIAFQRGLIDLFGVEPNLASAATVLYHPVSVYIPPVVFGLLFAWRDGLSPAKLRAVVGRDAG